MNLAEKYIEVNKGVVILISGLSGSNRTVLAKELSENCGGRQCVNSIGSTRTILAGEIERDFRLKLIALESYCRKENVKPFEIAGIKVDDWEHIDIYDWKQFNADVAANRKFGVVAYGDHFPTFKLTFKPDFHIHIYLPKDKLIEKRKAYIDAHPEKCPEMLDLIKKGKYDLLINKMTYPYYVEYRDKSKIDKWANADKNTPDEIYDQIFEYIIFSMRKFLNEHKNGVPTTSFMASSEASDSSVAADATTSSDASSAASSTASSNAEGDSDTDDEKEDTEDDEKEDTEDDEKEDAEDDE